MCTLFARITINRCLGRLLSSSIVSLSPPKILNPLQEEQLKERLYLVDNNDKILGTATKKECHLVNKEGKIPLHRAFSVFLFNSKNALLLQKRSETKITYPNCYTNSCCSHPVADYPGENEEQNALGVKRAAQRRLNYELGIPKDAIPLEKFTYITRVMYVDYGNGQWGEHEIDYILFVKEDVNLTPNPEEISAISYVPRNELDAFLPTLEGPLTPWFTLILRTRLKLWWDNIDNLQEFVDHEKILNLSKMRI